MKYVLLAVTIASSAVSAAAATPQFPPGVRGKWCYTGTESEDNFSTSTYRSPQMDGKTDCEPNAENIIITARQILSPEGPSSMTCDPVSISAPEYHGHDEVIYNVKLSCRNDGKRFTRKGWLTPPTRGTEALVWGIYDD